MESGSHPRSYLYVPGNRADRLHKCLSLGVDAIIADLEDSVPAADKQQARDNVAQWLRPGPGGPQRWVRIDPAAAGTDLRAAVAPALTGVVVAKADLDVLAEVDASLTEIERAAGRPERSSAVIALIESARGLQQAAQLAHAPRVCRMIFGEVDLLADLGIDHAAAPPCWIASLRLQVVLASAAAGLAAPVGPTALTVNDQAEMAAGARTLLQQGFRARTAIHPAQLPAIEQAFTPSADEIARARRLIEAFEEAGSGVAVNERGRLLDPAVLRGARDIVSRAPRAEPAHQGRGVGRER